MDSVLASAIAMTVIVAVRYLATSGAFALATDFTGLLAAGLVQSAMLGVCVLTSVKKLGKIMAILEKGWDRLEGERRQGSVIHDGHRQ